MWMVYEWCNGNLNEKREKITEIFLLYIMKIYCCVLIFSVQIGCQIIINILLTNECLFFYRFYEECKRRYTIKLWKTFTDCFNCLPVAAIGKSSRSSYKYLFITKVSLFTVDEKIFCCHGGLSPDLHSMEQIRRIMRPTDVPDQGLLCDLLWSDPDKDTNGWGENDRGVSFTFGIEVSDVSFYMNILKFIIFMCLYTICIKSGQVFSRANV